MVPVKTIIGTKLIECIRIDELKINNEIIKKDVLLGFMENKIKIDGIDCLLHYKLMEE